MFLDPYYLLYIIPAVLLMSIVSLYVQATYRKWSQVANRRGVTGYQAALHLISSSGLSGIQVEGAPGQLTDHYDPRKRVLRLSRQVAEIPSVASVAIAAHELGHALQDREGYWPLYFRNALVPVVNIGSNLGWWFIVLGLALTSAGMTNWGVNLAWLGVVAFASGTLFALATLPVELNASRRGRQLLSETGIVITEEERQGVNYMLNAAALTYVAAVVAALLQLLYYVGLVGGWGSRRRH